MGDVTRATRLDRSVGSGDLPAVDHDRLIVSGVIVRLAQREGIDLSALLTPYDDRRPPDHVGDDTGHQSRPMLDWSAQRGSSFTDPAAAFRFFETFELFPGLVVRGWGDPNGRLGFGLEDRRVVFELHVREAGMLIRGTPDAVTIAVDASLPDQVCAALVGQPLERLVAWPPAVGADYVVKSVEADGDMRIVTVETISFVRAGPGA